MLQFNFHKRNQLVIFLKFYFETNHLPKLSKMILNSPEWLVQRMPVWCRTQSLDRFCRRAPASHVQPPTTRSADGQEKKKKLTFIQKQGFKHFLIKFTFTFRIYLNVKVIKVDCRFSRTVQANFYWFEHRLFLNINWKIVATTLQVDGALICFSTSPIFRVLNGLNTALVLKDFRWHHF